MKKIDFNLNKHRLTIQLVKRRGDDIEKPLFPTLEEIKKTKKGNKISRFFRYVFEQKRVQKIFGANLAVAIITSSFLPNPNLENTASEKLVMAQESVTITTSQSTQYPVEVVKITQGYGLFHPGIDLDGVTGDEIRPTRTGYVENVSWSKYGYGNAVIINHGEGLTSLYAHLSEILVEVGENVNLDSVIGKMGATGRSFGDHLHLEIRSNGIPVNPSSVLPFPKK